MSSRIINLTDPNNIEQFMRDIGTSTPPQFLDLDRDGTPEKLKFKNYSVDESTFDSILSDHVNDKAGKNVELQAYYINEANKEQNHANREIMRENVRSETAQVFNTTDTQAMLSYVDRFQDMLRDPAKYVVNLEEVTFRVWHPTTSFAYGDLLDTEQKVSDYATEALQEVAFEAVKKQELAIQEYVDNKIPTT